MENIKKNLFLCSPVCFIPYYLYEYVKLTLYKKRKQQNSLPQYKIPSNSYEDQKTTLIKKDSDIAKEIINQPKKKCCLSTKRSKMSYLQLKVVLWKNLIIRKRHWFLTLCEALIPVSLFLLIAYGRSKITGLNRREINEVTYSDKMPILYSSTGINLEETQLYYSPGSKFFADIIHRVQEKIQIVNNNIQSFDSKERLLEEYARSHNNSVIAIIFNSAKDSVNFDYTLRFRDPYFNWDTDQLYKNQYSFVPNVGTTYLYKGFLAMQKALDMAFIAKVNGSEPDVDIETLEFPYPPYKSDSGMSSLFIHYLPLITLFSFIFVCPAVLKRVVEEKYSGIKELMKMVGMKPWMLWLGWFLYSILPTIISVSLLTIIMKVDVFGVSYPLIEFADGGVLFAFLFLYCMATTVNCFFLSTMFRKPTLATLVGLLFWILSYFVPKYLLDGRANVPFSANILLMFLPNMGLHYGYTAISYYEERELGIRWSNLHVPGGGGSNEVTMLHVFGMFIFDIILYMLLTFYLDSILPGKYGIPESIFFPLKRLRNLFRRRNNVGGNNQSENMNLRDVDVETGRGLTKGIELINLTKKYGKKTVVDNLSLEIYQDQITALLGHNGAGKSTTMGMITGMIQKTSGHIIMNGKSIESSYDVKETIGLCPQHNLFFPDLTVAEHLKFFALLKGKTAEESDIEIGDLLIKLNLEDKKNDMAHTLSGGMQRKLCLGMAVVGGSKVLILDEPSSGMDPQSRRHMWDLLLSWRNDKTILITTHFMEEADALGDWIAIMNEGKLRCYGTPMYLKKSFETGYNLNLLIKKDENVDEVVANLEREISQFVYKPKCKSINGHEVVFLLPFENNYIKMFEHLEANRDRLKIDNISFTTTTLEDVFLNSKGSPDDDAVDNKSDLASIASSALLGTATKVHELDMDNCDEHSYKLTIGALIYKRYHFICRKMKTYLIPLFIALIFLLLCVYLGQGANDYSSSGGPELKLKLSTYGKTAVMFNNSNDPEILRMKLFYRNSVVKEKSDFQDTENVEEEIINKGISNLPYYKRHMVAAAEFARRGDHIEAVAMYNGLAVHSAPISLNLITNTLAKAMLGEQYSISASNHPLDNINTDTTVDELSEVQIGLLWLIIMPLGFLFFLGSFIYFPYVELSTNFTQLQFMCGVAPWLYWLTTYLSDLLMYLMFAVVMCVFSLAWTPFRGANEFGSLLLILALYGASGIPYAYLFGRRKSFSGAYALFIILGIMLGVILTTIVSVLEESGDNYYMNMGENLKVLFLIFCPQFSFTYSGVIFARKVINNYNFDHISRLKRLSECSREEPNPCCHGNGSACENYKSYLAILQPNIGWILFGAALYLFCNIIIHNYWLRKQLNTARHFYYFLFKKDAMARDTSIFIPDKNDNGQKNTLKVNQLKKSYSGREVVGGIGFNLKKGECMGILGVNGAGKTTTFKMLTREEIKDTGDIKIDNVTIDEKQYLRRLGYCPQNDALNYSLTGRDILQTMAWLRGIRDTKIVEKFLDLFELKEFADVPCEHYSGGNKRKLSFAVAVIGFPDVILLDEPTNGVDPSSRRKFWSLIKTIKDTCNNSFVLTSHSMVECEALCNDLNIMKKGTIKRTGTISYLKKQMDGFSVKIKLKPSLDKVSYDDVDGVSSSAIAQNYFEERIKSIKQKISEVYKEAEIRDEHPGLIHYYIKTTGPDKRWSNLFKQFENLKTEYVDLIEDYSISEASLEDVFLGVAREKDPDEEDDKKNTKKSIR